MRNINRNEEYEQANRIRVEHSDTDPNKATWAEEKEREKGILVIFFFFIPHPLLSLANNHVTMKTRRTDRAVGGRNEQLSFGSIFCFNHSFSSPWRSFAPFNNKVSYDVTQSAYWFKRRELHALFLLHLFQLRTRACVRVGGWVCARQKWVGGSTNTITATSFLLLLPSFANDVQ